jgi:cation/acetate symporter
MGRDTRFSREGPSEKKKSAIRPPPPWWFPAAFAVVASANVPTILLTIFWRKFNTTGAIVGILVGLVSAMMLVLISPSVLTGSSVEAVVGPRAIIPVEPLSPFMNPALFSVPLGFLACVIGTLVGGRGAEREQEQRIQTDYDEIYVRSLTSLSPNIDQELQEASRRPLGH